MVACLDWGSDWVPPAFRRQDGRTRLLAIWDQRGGDPSGSVWPYGYGRLLDRDRIDRALAEDCVQEVFLRLVRHRGSWRPDAKFTTYLYRIAENHWIDRYRSRKSAPQMASLEGLCDPDEPSAPGHPEAGEVRALIYERASR